MNRFRITVRKLGVLAVTLTGLFLQSSPTHALVTPPQVTNQPSISQGLSTPVRVIADQTGNLFVADPRAGGIQYLTANGELIATITTAKHPLGIALTSGGDLLVSQGSYVALLSRAANYAETHRLQPTTGPFKLANGIALTTDGAIFVTDSLDNAVHAFRADFIYKFRFGSAGSQTGTFNMPTGITYEKSADQVAVVDTMNGRIQFFSTDGTFQKAIGTRGYGNLAFSSPQAVSFEYSRAAVPLLARMYVVDSFQSNIQVIDPSATGGFLGFIGAYGVTAGKLSVPVDVLFDSLHNRLIVANDFANLVTFGISGNAFTTDTTAPVITSSPHTATATNNNSLTITGTVNKPATIIITANTAAVIGRVTFPTATTWSCPVNGLAVGVNTITISARDTANNNSAKQSFTITYNPSAPQLAISPVTSPTRSQDIVVTGTVDRLSTITVTASSGTVGDVAIADGRWSVPLTGLITGSTTITATAAKDGNSAVVSTEVTVDNQNPALHLSALNGVFTASPLLNIYGQTDSDVSQAVVTLNSATLPPLQVSNGTFNCALQLKAGLNSFMVAVSDALGNTTLSPPHSVTYDGTQSASAISAPADCTTTTAPTITVSGATPNGYSVTATVNGGNPVTLPGASWSTNLNLAAVPGLNTIEVTTTNGAITTSDKRTIIVSETNRAPWLNPVDPPVDRVTNAPAYTVSGNTLDSNGINTAVSIAGAVNGIATPIDFTLGTYVIPLTFTTEGPYTATVTAFDANGNSSTVSRTVVYDVTGPQITIDPANPQKLTVSGDIAAIKNDGVDLTHNVSVLKTYNQDGTITLDFTPLNLTSAQRNRLVFIDAAGNSSRDGKISNTSGTPTIVDALRAMKLAARISAPTSIELLRGDVAPLIGGVSVPDGKIDIDDVLAILYRVVGKPWE